MLHSYASVQSKILVLSHSIVIIFYGCIQSFYRYICVVLTNEHIHITFSINVFRFKKLRIFVIKINILPEMLIQTPFKKETAMLAMNTHHTSDQNLFSNSQIKLHCYTKCKLEKCYNQCAFRQSCNLCTNYQFTRRSIFSQDEAVKKKLSFTKQNAVHLFCSEYCNCNSFFFFMT